jgi:hypothetical protein
MRLIPAIVLVLLVGVAAATRPASASQAGVQASGCTLLEVPGLRFEQVITDLGVAGAPTARLCLLNIPSEDVYKGAVLGVTTVAQFRAARDAAVGKLASAGVDICRIATWDARGTGAPQLPMGDRWDLPPNRECKPRIVAADEGAQEWVSVVDLAFGQAVEETVAQMGWRPNRGLQVRVFTDLERAIPVFQQYVVPAFPGETAANVAQNTRDGISWHLYVTTTYGNIILLNLATPRRRTAEGVKGAVASTYTNYAVVGMGGSGRGVQYQWFRLGLNSYQAERNGGIAAGWLSMAARHQRDGRGIPLRDISTNEGWTLRRQRDGANAVQARCHAAVVFLIEQYGFEAVLNLVRENREGDLDSFGQLLTKLTGMDIEALDAALNTWLGDAPPVVSTPPAPMVTAAAPEAGSAGFRVDLQVSTGATYGEATIAVTRALPCGPERAVDPGTHLSFPITVTRDGAFEGRGYFGNAVVALSGTLTDGTVRGTLRWTDQDDTVDRLTAVFQVLTGVASGTLSGVCDTGALPFEAGR